MADDSNTAHSLRRVFYEGFVAQDIAEPLASFDVSSESEEVARFMVDRPLSVVGIRRNGVVAGFIQQGEIDERSVEQQMRPLEETQVLSASTPLHDVVAALESSSFLLVSVLGQPVGVIVRDDFEKPPMRMWLFGMVTLFELSLTRIVDDHYQNESWTDLISESRIAKARLLQTERNRRNKDVRLIDCLQLGDKGQLMARSEELRTQHFQRSRRQIEKMIKEMEALRNNLAHSQPLVTENWDVIVRMSSALERFLAITTEFVSPSSLNPYNADG